MILFYIKHILWKTFEEQQAGNEEVEEPEYQREEAPNIQRNQEGHRERKRYKAQRNKPIENKPQNKGKKNKNTFKKYDFDTT